MPPPLPRPTLVGDPAPVDWSAMQRVLAVRPDNLGDVVMSGPALRALRAAMPREAHLDLLASPAGAPLAEMLRGVDGVVVERVVWQDASGAMGTDPERELALVDRLRGYDAVVALTSFSQSPWPVATLAALAGVPVRAGQSGEFGGSLLTHRVLPPAVGAREDQGHQVDRQLHLLAALGVAASDTDLHLDVPLLAVQATDALLAEHGVDPDRPLAVVLPGASCPSRRWGAERFAAVARRLRADGVQVLVVGSAGEADLVDAVAGPAGALGLAGALDVPGLAALLTRADVAVTNNSGGMHLADALGTPVVVLFAGTERVAEYVPRGLLRRDAARVFTVDVDCSPCRAFACPYAQECLAVDPPDVAAAALDLARAGRPVAG